MSAVFDVFAYLTVLLRGLDLVAQSVLIGAVSFLIFVIRPILSDVDRDSVGQALRVARVAAAATIATATAITLLNAAVLKSLLDASWTDVARADFVFAGAARTFGAAGILATVSRRDIASPWRRTALLAFAALILAGGVATTHAVARAGNVTPFVLATAAHELGAAIWLGGLPCLWLALRRWPTPAVAARIGHRYSFLAFVGVGLIAAGAIAFAIVYVGSFDAVYGTAYGMMSLVKTALLIALLALGYTNLRVLRSDRVDAASIGRVRRFVEVEMGLGCAALMAAASITSLPPAVDLVADRVAWSEIVERWRPTLPRLESPEHSTLALSVLQARLDDEARRSDAKAAATAFAPDAGPLAPRNAFDIAWSEYNHHWAGLVVALMGVAALAQRSGRVPWARHWPLLFVGLAAFLFLRADPEVWPIGDRGFFASLQDPEVLQHRIFVVLIVAFAIFEWRVQTDRFRSLATKRVFPLITAVGGTLLLTHSHALGNVKEELLIESTHLPIAILGIAAGCTRWLEVETPRDRSTWVGFAWPLCFVLIGFLLLGYREA